MKIFDLFKKLLFVLFFYFASFSLFSKFGEEKMLEKFELTYNIKNIPLTPIDFRDNSVFLNLLCLHIASSDKKVTKLNIVFEDSFYLPSWYVQELVKVIFAFKRNVKTVSIWMNTVKSIDDFVLLAACDEKYILESSAFILPGYQMGNIFSAKKDLKEKRNAVVFQSGDFKGGASSILGSEFDMYVSFNRRAFLFDILNQSKSALSFFLNKNLFEIESYIQHAYYTSKDALNLGFVTGFGAYSPSFEHVDLNVYSKKLKRNIYYSKKNIAVLSLNFGLESSPFFDVYVNAIYDLAKNSDIKGVLLLIDCPGGEIYSIEKFDRAIQNLRKNGKYVVAYVINAFSGGYWLASGADKIFANYSSGVGSIGSYSYYREWLEEYEEKGYSIDYIYTHDEGFKAKLTDKYKEYAKKNTSSYFDFVDLVKKRRNIDINIINDIAQGQIYTGESAKKINLVDSLDGLIGALDLLYFVCGKEQMGFLFFPDLDIFQRLYKQNA